LTKIGIMQGRLVPPEDGRLQSFPRTRWLDEFRHAASVPLDYIEWIYDLYGADANPIGSDTGLGQLRAILDSTSIEIRSLCADYFMDRPFVRCSEGAREQSLQMLEQLMRWAQRIGVKRIVLPFVDASEIRTTGEFDTIVGVLNASLSAAEETGVEVHLETSLPPDKFAALLKTVPHPMIKVNYDSGNSASLGYPPAEEFAAYGPRIGSVHIKDRICGGGTVPLGTGSTDFDAVFEGLRKIAYSGDFTLQVARGEPGHELAWAKMNLEFLRHFWPM
jgi:L-ribulose-5-phosphate 3-epimerase